MNGKKHLLGVLAGGILLAGTVGSSYAADPTPTPQTATLAYCQGIGGMAASRWGGTFSALEPVAKLLGVQMADIAAERQAGKSLVQIAQAKGVDEAKLIETIVADRKANLDALVKAGTIAQAQADLMLQQMQTRVKTAVERTTVGPMGPASATGPGMGQGGRMGRGFGARAGR